MALYDPLRHEPLVADDWSETTVREVVAEIVDEAVAAFSRRDLYPVHPREDMDWPNGGSSHYLGAGGVLWAVDYLRRRGFADAVDVAWVVDGLESLVDRVRDELADNPMRDEVSYLFGDLPILIHLVTLTGEDRWRQRAAGRFADSVSAPVREMMWGTPGVLIAGNVITDADLRSAIQEHLQANRRKLADAWCEEANGLIVWREALYGGRRLFVGPVHGFAGQVLPLLQSLDALDERIAARTLEQAKRYLLGVAVRESGLANWPAIQPEADEDPRAGMMPVQYCHGAPGMVTSFCAYPPDGEVDRALVDGGELVWRSGPLTKGANLCHGTGGNGYAFLKLHERTGDALWLDRARRFAMHGIRQYRSEREAVGRQRFTLWTGDPGFAVYLAACVDGDARFPTIDVF